MEKIISILIAHPFFANVQRKYLESLARTAKMEKIQERDFLIREGQEADKLFIILHGQAVLLTEKVMSESSREVSKGTFQKLGPGEIIGWSWLVPPHQWRFDARALSPMEVLVVDADLLRRMCEENSKLGYEILMRLTHVMVDRLTAARIQLALSGADVADHEEGG